MKINYYKAIRTLIIFSDRLKTNSSHNNGALVDYFQKYKLNNDEEDSNLPSTDEIAAAINFKKPKVHKLIYEMYRELLSSFYDDPIKIRRFSCFIYIHVPREELDSIANKQRREEAKNLNLWLQVELSVIPRVGEDISLEFIDDSLRYARGQVLSVTHQFSGDRQSVILYVHPYESSYSKWVKMKDEFEYWQKVKRDSYLTNKLANL